MRPCRDTTEREQAFRLAQSEALSAFGDASVYLEKTILEPHHIEVQILGDQHGNVVHLGERECSIQRRHQKVIEESPSPFVSESTRADMCEIAVRAAQEIGYTNAGTMEFLVDADQKFYFLEMNTRLQVEHPVTEMVTSIDMVKEQFRIASGEKLSFGQKDIRFRGAAIECRIYAEDPDKNFMPSPGKILSLRVPGGPGVRDDSGIYEGFEVPIHYDPLLSKLITWGETRKEAILRMSRALEEYNVMGVKTAIPFYQRVMQDPIFQQGIVTTGFIALVFSAMDETRTHPLQDIAIIAAAISEFEIANTTSPGTMQHLTQKQNLWKWMARKEGLDS